MFDTWKKLQYKELFLYVFFVTFFIGTFSISIVSLFLGHTLSFIVTASSFCFGFYMLYDYAVQQHTERSSVMLLWVIAFIVFAHIFINGFNTDVIYILLLPMTAPILLSRKTLLRHATIYLIISLFILVYGLQSGAFNNPRSISGFSVLSVFVFLFGSTYHIAIEESYKKLEESNRQKDFLLKEIHHRVKNNLNIVASILGLEKFESDVEEVHKLINKNKLRIESIAMVHEILYENSNLEHIDFKTYLQKLCKHIIATESSAENIGLHLNIVQLSLNIETMMQFGIIINELITNSIKHAFISNKGQISIALVQQEHNYKLTYRDNGAGMQNSTKGFGTNLIEMSIQQIEGTLEVHHTHGLQYDIYFNEVENANTYR